MIGLLKLVYLLVGRVTYDALSVANGHPHNGHALRIRLIFGSLYISTSNLKEGCISSRITWDLTLPKLKVSAAFNLTVGNVHQE